MTHNTSPQTKDSLTNWLKRRIAEYARLPPEEIQADASLATYGLDSVYALTLSDEIQEHLGVLIAPTIVWDAATLTELVSALLTLRESDAIRD
jgi:acyl carrier protein